MGGYGNGQNEGTVATVPKPKPIEPLKLEQDLGNAASALPLPGIEPAKAQPKKQPHDPRFPDICDAIRKCWPKGNGYKCDITPADAGASNRMLAQRHNWTAEELSVCILARFNSHNINPTESVKAWIGAIADYQSGPQNRHDEPKLFGKDLEDWRENARVIIYGRQPVQQNMESTWRKPPVTVREETPEEREQRAEAEALFDRVRDYIKHRISPHQFDTWIKPLRPAYVRKEVLYLRIPTPELSHACDKFGALMREALDGQKACQVAVTMEQSA